VALAGLGEVLLSNGKVDAAIENFRKALRIRPDNAEVHGALAGALMRNGQASEAISHWERAVALQPEAVQARDQLGALLVQQGKWRDALAQWRESLKYDPDDANALNNLAWVLATAGDSSARDGTQAVVLAQRASRIAGGANPLILRTLAAAQAESGDFSGAMETGERGMQSANEQHNPALADELRRNMTLYEAKTPLRDPTLRDSVP
jgi:Flp pilus assembly protein TadD